MAMNLEQSQESEQFQVLDPANLPDKPSFPDKKIFTFGGFGGGLAFAFGLVFLLESLDTTMNSEHDVEVTLKLPVLAMIPVIGPVASKRAPAASMLGSYK